jgi:phosphate transport system substrate-binding protein
MRAMTIGLMLLTLAAGCRRPAAVIRVDGSSTVFPISEAMAEEFRKAHPGVQVTVGVSGTGGGFKRLCGGEIDIADASRRIKPSEVELCAKNGVRPLELPVAHDGIAIVVHPKNDWADHITTSELKRLWEPGAQGRVLRWSQVRPGWPDREIHLFGPGVDSGTYDYFTEAIVGKAQSSRGDFTASEDDNVLVQGVAGDPLALGFFGYAYYAENRGRVRAVPVDDGRADNGAGPIAPAEETIRSGTYHPLSRPVFIYVAAAALKREPVQAFVRFYLDQAPRLVRQVGYVPMPAPAYQAARRQLPGAM